LNHTPVSAAIYRRNLLIYTAALTLLISLASLLPGCSKTQTPGDQTPKLAVVIVVDQMRADYLTRFEHLYSGGLARFVNEGAWFTRAYHSHAQTTTAVGPATLATGCYPGHHGIVANEWFDRDSRSGHYACDDPDATVPGYSSEDGASPISMLCPSAGDRLRVVNPQSKAISIALKDRAAILTGGHTATAAYWYLRPEGVFVTSSFSDSVAHPWAETFNESGFFDTLSHVGWSHCMPESVYTASRNDTFPAEHDGVHTTFPHTFDDISEQPDTTFYREMYCTPFGDAAVIELARRAVEVEQLGMDNNGIYSGSVAQRPTQSGTAMVLTARRSRTTTSGLTVIWSGSSVFSTRRWVKRTT
jgi:hypothetical protein